MEIGFWIEYAAYRRVARKARTWPSVTGRVEHVASAIIPTKTTRWAIQVAYAYTVDGETYGNTERRFFTDSSQARLLEERLMTTSIAVRYDPATPTRSFMDLEIIST